MQQLMLYDPLIHASLPVQRHFLPAASPAQIRLAELTREYVDEVALVSSRSESNASFTLDGVHRSSHEIYFLGCFEYQRHHHIRN